LSKTEHGRERNRVNSAKHYHKVMAKAKIADFASESAEKLDVVRRAMAEHPPELSSEADTVAYFRGFLAGAQRSSGESYKINSVKDLIHRIAASEHRKRWRMLSYEDAVSSAYEAVLELIRSSRCPDDLLEFRRIAAIAIRRRCIDVLRKNIGRNGQKYALHLAFNQGEEEGTIDHVESGSSIEPRDALDDAIDGLRLLTDRQRQVLEFVAEGLTLVKIGERIGVTEARVWQIIRELREEHPELEQRLLGA